MFKNIAEELSIVLLRYKIIEMSERKYYIYGLEALIPKVILYTLIFIVALLTNTIIISAVFTFCYLFLRQYCGGYHCKTAEMCLICSLFIYLMILFIYMFPWNKTDTIPLILAGISFGLITMMSPMESENKPLEKEEKKKYKVISLIISAIYFTATFIFYSLNLSDLYYSLSCSLVATAILMIISIRRKCNKKNSS